MDKRSLIKKNIENALELKTQLLSDSDILACIEHLTDAVINCYKNKGKVLFCGNGGSAADAQHLAAELSGRYYYDRPPLSSEALHVNTSYLTAVANDYSYEQIYSRMIKAIGEPGDVLIGLSTSGNSENVVRALEVAQEKGMTTISFTGEGGGKMKALSQIHLEIPSKDTPRIQECHMLVGHTMCEIVERALFPND
jgi:D-sedoheptulose 7-phosphate isomerase